MESVYKTIYPCVHIFLSFLDSIKANQRIFVGLWSFSHHLYVLVYAQTKKLSYKNLLNPLRMGSFSLYSQDSSLFNIYICNAYQSNAFINKTF